MAEQQQPEALAQIAAILQQLQQQNQQAQQQAAAGPAQPQYALTPGRANPGAFIDYNTRAGIAQLLLFLTNLMWIPARSLNLSKIFETVPNRPAGLRQVDRGRVIFH